MVRMMPHQFVSALDSLKARIEDAVQLGNRILENLGVWGEESKLPFSWVTARNLQGIVATLTEHTVPTLQKEVTEALGAADTLQEGMERSEASLWRVLELVRYRFGTDDPRVREFFSPPNGRGFGWSVEARLRAHAVVDEAAVRHAEAIPEVDRPRLGEAHEAGELLAAARAAFEREGGEGQEAVRETARLLARFRSGVSALRRRLKAELEVPDNVYEIIPKVKTSAASAPEPAPVAPPATPAE